MTNYAPGIGGTYSPPSIVEDGEYTRNEKVITKVIRNKKITIRVRTHISPVDLILLHTKASIYTKQTGGLYPVPPISRKVKEALIEVAK